MALAVAALESVIDDQEMIETMVVPAGMPGPVTVSPTARGTLMVSIQFDRRGRVLGQDDGISSRIWEIVVPVGIPVPVTVSPTARFTVVDKLVTLAWRRVFRSDRSAVSGR